MNENAFAFIVQARPFPTFGRPVHLRSSPHRLQPGTSPHALRIPPHDGHPALRKTAGDWLQVHLGCVQLSPSCPFRLLHTCFLFPAREALPPRSNMALLIRAPEGLEPSRSTRCSAHTMSPSETLSPSTDFLGAPVIRLPCSADFATGRGGFLQLLSASLHRAVASTPPE